MDEHRDLVIAHLAVVRRATEVLAAHGVAASAPIEAAIQIVERWAIEGGVDGDDLAAAARAAWDDGAPLRLAHEPALRARMWLGTAAGNLGQMARAERGWKGTPRTILDAAASALASLDVPGLPRRPELAQLAADALAAVAPAPGRRPTPGPPPPIPLGPTPELGELASAYLAPRAPARDPRLTADRAALTALLSARGLPLIEAALAFEARYGGTTFAEAEGDDTGRDIVLGPYALLKDEASAQGLPPGLIPIALSPSDVWYFVDATGRVWAQDTIEDAEPVPFASTATIALARLVLYLRAFSERHTLGGADLPGHQGASVASALGVPPIAEASDEYARAWGNATALVFEHEIDEQPTTTVVGAAAPPLPA